MKQTCLIVNDEIQTRFVSIGEWSLETHSTFKALSKDTIMKIIVMLTNPKLSTMVPEKPKPEYKALDHNICRVMTHDAINVLQEVDCDFERLTMTVKNEWIFHVRHGTPDVKPTLRVMKDGACLVNVQG